jgi:hypothetical protein
MMKAPAGGVAGFDADPDDEDTIEMVLTPADMRLLAQAAGEPQRQATSVPESTAPSPTTDSTLQSMPSQTTTRPGNSANLARGALAGVAGALVIIVAIASVSTARLTTDRKATPAPERHQLVAAAASAASEPSPQAAAAVPDAQPLHYKNPFDKSEVFEFPAGTTLEEARQSVADLLLQRAHGRHIRPGLQHSRVNGAIPRRSAKQAELAQTSTRG